MEIPQGTPWKIAENRTLKRGPSPPRAEIPTFKWLFSKNLRSTTGMPLPASLFRAPMTHALLFNRSCTRLSAHQASTATAWTFFQIAWTDSESRPRPDVRIEIQDHSRRHSSSSAPIDAWIQKMDVDSDGGRREFGLRGQRRGTESDKGTAANSLSGYHAPKLKKILACLRPWSDC